MHDLQASIQQLLEYVKGIWIKKRYIIISTWLLCPIGFVYVAMMPDKYESTAKVYADTRSMLKPLLRGIAVETNPDQEIKLIARTLLSTPNLQDIARQTDLDIDARSAKDFENIVSGLKDDIDIDFGGRQSLYTISYEHTDPNKAKMVVSATLDKFVESSLGQSRKDSDGASKFLEQQIMEYASRLETSELRLADFKKQYGDLIASKNSNYYDQRNEMKNQVEAVNLKINELEKQRASLKEKFVVNESGSSADSINIETQYDERITELETQLDGLQIRFTDIHPDVVQTKQSLAALKEARKSEIEELLKGLSNGKIASGGLSENAIVQNLSIMINEIESELASLNVRKSTYLNKLEELEQKLELIPDVEAKRTGLIRDYEITKKKYEELLSRKESAELSRKADLSSEEVQFRIVEPPVAPLTPTGPKRILMYTLVLVAGFGLGITSAFLVSQINPVVVNLNQLSKLTNRPVLGAITDVHRDEIVKKETLRKVVFAISSLLVFGVYMVFVASEIMLNATPIELLRNYL